MTAMDYRPPRRQDFDSFTEHDAAWKQWVSDELVRTRTQAVDRLSHIDKCIDELKEAVATLLKWMRGEELEEARHAGAQDVTKRQRAFLTGMFSSVESWVGKAALLGLGGGVATFLWKVVGL